MKNLKEIVKKSYFKPIIHIIGIIFALWAIAIMYEYNKLKIEDGNKQRLEIIRKYENRINEKDSINEILMKKEKSMQLKIDSLENVKQKIIIKYDEKIKSIYNASANEHAVWLDSTVAKVNRLKK